MNRLTPLIRPLIVLGTLALAAVALPSHAASAQECTAIKMCYCVNQDFIPLIESKVKFFREAIAAERAKGKAIGYLSVPLSTFAGGYFDVNAEVSLATKQRLEARFGSSSAWILNPGTKESDLTLPSGVRGTHGDYMLMWTRILEGPTAMGEDFDFVYFAGPTDFAAYFGLTGSGDMDKLAAFFDDRLAKDASLKRAVERKQVDRNSFRNYYSLRASVAFSNGAHDEWNIFRILNERRRADPKLGTPSQIPVLFDGKAVSAAAFEQAVMPGSSGVCKTN